MRRTEKCMITEMIVRTSNACQCQCTHLLSMDVCWRSEFNGINGIIFNKKWMHLDAMTFHLCIIHDYESIYISYRPCFFATVHRLDRINGHFMLCGISSAGVVPLRSTSHLTAFFWIVHIQLEWADCPFLVNILFISYIYVQHMSVQ